MHENNWYVYIHTTPSGMIYVGISHFEDPNIRWKNGLGYKHNPHFNNAIQKYGWDNITHEIIEKNLDFETAKQKEIDYILEYKHLGMCYNITDGGDGHYGQKLTEKHKQRISNTLKQKHPIPWNKGKTGVYSEETRQKMGAGMRGKVGPNKGKKRPPVSQETRKKLSESLKGKNTWSKGSIRGSYSKEHREKISKALKGKRKVFHWVNVRKTLKNKFPNQEKDKNGYVNHGNNQNKFHKTKYKYISIMGGNLVSLYEWMANIINGMVK